MRLVAPLFLFLCFSPVSSGISGWIGKNDNKTKFDLKLSEEGSNGTFPTGMKTHPADLEQSLVEGKCNTTNHDLATIFYKTTITLNVADKEVVQKCSEPQLLKVGEVINGALEKMDLEDKYEDIKEIDNRLCLDPEHSQQDRSLDNRKLHWRVSSQYLYFYMFRGGGKCRFCYHDDFDRRKLRLPLSEESSRVEEPGLHQYQLRGSSGKKIDAEDAYDESLLGDEDEEVDYEPRLIGDEPGFTDEGVLMNASSPEIHRSLLNRRCGCPRVTFNTDGKGRPIYGTPYIVKNEWEERFGFTVEVTEIKGPKNYGYAPDRRVRLYSSNFYARNRHEGDPDLGSPNENCSEQGGPGKGEGGAPLREDGKPNPGANCKYLGKVMIIQERKKIVADDSFWGGTITFTWTKDTVHLRDIGLFDIHDSSDASLKIYWQNSKGEDKVSYHRPHGYGDNSIEMMDLSKRKNVRKMQVRFRTTGAISGMKFCFPHSCPEVVEVPDSELSVVEAFEKKLKPHIEADAIRKITAALRDESIQNDDFCLGPTEASVDVDMTVADSTAALC